MVNEDDLLVFERTYRKRKLKLIINMTNKDKSININSNLISNEFESGILKNEGFVISFEKE